MYSPLSLISSIQPQKKTEVGELTSFGFGPRGKQEVFFSLESKLHASAQLLFKICTGTASNCHFDSCLAPVPSIGNFVGLRGREEK